MNIKKLNNEQGAGLIVAYFVMASFVTFSAAFSILTFSELNQSIRFRDSVQAFWLAEAGVDEYIHDPAILETKDRQNIPYGQGVIRLARNDSSLSKRVVTSTGDVRGVKRTIKVEFPAIVPVFFENAVTVNGDILISGGKTNVTFNDKVRLSGEVKNQSKYSQVTFEDKMEKVPESLVSLIYPDMDHNSKPDEFADFVAFNRDLIASYSSDEVIYIKDAGTVTVVPNEALSGKKIIYVEGTEGKGNVNIQFSGAWEGNQNLTIISTGTVTYSQASPVATNSQLNVIAWSGYNESAALPGTHQGIVYTHGKAVFDEVHDTSVTNGVVIAKEGIELREVWSNKTFNYVDPRVNGVLPPGFEGLVSGTLLGYEKKPTSWEEI